ncbi:MAG: DUF115 domain-containing protein, partial [Treponema sp.]|nr:DUF115 domain-containing protein [Treponema sp.]
MQRFARKGITLLSGHDPAGRCERIADAVSVRKRTLYFCPSPLYGYGLEKLLSRIAAAAPGSAVLCIEADTELYELTKKNINSSLMEDRMLRITNICEAKDLCVFVRETWGARAFQRIETIKLTGGWQLFSELYDFLFKALQREIAIDWSNALTLTKLGRLYIRNALRNLSLIPHYPSIANLSYGESPVLVLGAGPSLDETLDVLEKHFSKTFSCPETRGFRIICVDTCLGALKDRNIVPDLAVILESQHWNMRDFIGCRGWDVKSAVDLSSLPQSARLLAAGGFLFMTPWTHLRIFERLKAAGLLPAVIPPLGSVGLTAVELSRRVTSGKIICAGLDFSFDTGKYHARGTPGHRSRIYAQGRFGGIADNAAFATASSAFSKSGVSVRTNPVMRNYRDLFETEFGGDPRLFDVMGSGLPLGLKIVSPDEAAVMLGDNADKKNPGNFNAKAQRRKGADLTEENHEKNKILLTKKTSDFIYGEKKYLTELRDILMGETAAEQG